MTKPDWLLLIAATLLLTCAPSLAGQETQLTNGAGSLRQASSEKATLPSPTIVAHADPRLPNGRYRLRKGDILELNFPLVPTFNQIITVQPDGFITLRVLGDLRVEGKTIPELTGTLRAEYGSILRDPIVTVELKDFEKPYFIVAGEVERPGKYDLRGETTVTQAVAVAGGLKERAKHSQVMVFRRVSAGGFDVKHLDLKKMLKEAHLREDLHLEPGDMLFVPKGRVVDLGALMSSLWLLPYLLNRY